jgi:hypothetical protein
LCSPCAFAGGSSSRAAQKGQKTRKRARRGKQLDVDEDDREVVLPTKTTRREKSVAAKQRAALPVPKWKIKDWERIRFQDPYSAPANPRWNNPQFRNDFQMRIISEVFENHKNKVTKMWSVDLEHWRRNPDYFGEALEICEEFDLIKIMELNCDFDV